MKSILELERAEGYKQGREEANFYNDQVKQCIYDNGYLKGEQDAEARYPKVWKWYVAGILTCVILYLSLYFWNR